MVTCDFSWFQLLAICTDYAAYFVNGRDPLISDN